MVATIRGQTILHGKEYTVYTGCSINLEKFRIFFAFGSYTGGIIRQARTRFFLNWTGQHRTGGTFLVFLVRVSNFHKDHKY